MHTDFELLDRWRAGDAGAGNTLFQRHFAGICRFFTGKVGEARDELIQATFLECVRSIDQFRRQSSFRTYLFAIARHQLFKHLRARRRHSADIDFTVTSLADLGTTPTGRLARDEQRGLLLRALHALPLDTQLLLELYYWEDMGIAELAEVLGIEQPAARARLSRARKALRVYMDATADSKRSSLASRDSLDAWARSLRDHGDDEDDPG